MRREGAANYGIAAAMRFALSIVCITRVCINTFLIATNVFVHPRCASVSHPEFPLCFSVFTLSRHHLS